MRQAQEEVLARTAEAQVCRRLQPREDLLAPGQQDPPRHRGGGRREVDGSPGRDHSLGRVIPTAKPPAVPRHRFFSLPRDATLLR